MKVAKQGMDRSGSIPAQAPVGAERVNGVEIVAASQEQSSGIEQVNRAVMQMAEVTRQDAALVEEAAAEAIVEQAQTLNSLISRYRVNASETVQRPLSVRRAGAENALQKVG